MASLRHRRGIAEAEDYEDVYDDGSRSSDGDGTAADDSATEEEEEEEEQHCLNLGISSMTAKGIQHLCSELLEIKKASEEDFRANVYLSYLSFIRMLQEAGGLDKDVQELKRQVIAHRRLIQRLSSSSCLVLSSKEEEEEEEAEVTVTPAAAGDDMELELLEVQLDVLLSEHRTEQALELLEEVQRTMGSTISSKARVADRLASVAGNPRTPLPELLRALSGLCRLGDAPRANHLLFKFFRSSGSPAGGNYLRDLVRMVFSSILEASRSFVALHGHPSPYTPQLVRWAREEMEDLGAAFSAMPMPSQQQVLALVLEAAECAVSCSSSLLRTPGLEDLAAVVSKRHVVGLMAPCIRDVLASYARHLKEVIRLLVASDAWVLGSFGIPLGVGVVGAGAEQQPGPERCLLTTSGRKFVTLVQEVAEDVARPLLNLGMNDSVLQLVADLFGEYMHSVVQLLAIDTPSRSPRKQPPPPAALQISHNNISNNGDGGGDDHNMWQLSVLINCTTLVSLFPAITGISNNKKGDEDEDEDGEASSRLGERQVDRLISLIREAAGQVWTCFCQQFIRDITTMSSITSPSAGSAAAGCMMPSFPFQVLFLRVRQLNSLYGAILSGKDGTMKKLLQELMEAMLSWLSGSLDQDAPIFPQVQLDVHFLLEFAELGGFSCDNIRSSALELLRRAAQDKEAALLTSPDQAKEEDWATDAAKHAVRVLLRSARPQLHVVQANGAAMELPLEEEEEDDGDDDDDDDDEGREDQQRQLQGIVISAPDEDHTGAAKSSDEFISIEEEEDDGGGVVSLPLHSDKSEDVTSTDEADDRHDVMQIGEAEAAASHHRQCHQLPGAGAGQSRRHQAARPAAAAGRSRKKKREAVSRSSRPRWQ